MIITVFIAVQVNTAHSQIAFFLAFCWIFAISKKNVRNKSCI